MGAWRRAAGRTRRAPVRYAVTLACAAALGATACDPVDGPGGRMNTAAVALTTDGTATRELERGHADVAWLSCTARFADRTTARGASGSAATVVRVDCQGETDDGKDITVKGTVRSVVDGDCVRGRLTARVDGKVRFQADVLGDCGAGDGHDDGGGNGGGGHDGSGKPSAPPGTQRPPPSHEPQDPRPTVTVTVTADPPPRPTCTCHPGK
ncbi:hypothetical protein [Streptomyces sp. NPDC002564]|uniref:hypothetical protein n=1 Tax=Streptomyces sp. NPDC002564 TaxID=3364649 RepID=UPI00367489EF